MKKRIRTLSSLTTILALFLAVQTLGALPARAAEPVLLQEETAAADEVITPVEEVVTAQAATANTIKWFEIGEDDSTMSGSGLDWKNSTLTLTNYTGGAAIVIRNAKGTQTKVNVVVKGDNTIDSLMLVRADVYISGNDKNKDILRIRAERVGVQYMLSTQGGVNISDVTLDGICTSTYTSTKGLRIENSDGSAFTIKNTILNMKFQSGDYGIGSDSGACPVVMENTVYTFESTDPGGEGWMHPVKCGYSSLTVKNTVMNVKGDVGDIWSGTMTADNLKLKADGAYRSQILGAATAVIRNSEIRATGNRIIQCSDRLDMINTKVVATAYSFTWKDSTSTVYRRETIGIEGGALSFQGCDLTLKLMDADQEKSDWYPDNAAIEGSEMTFADTKADIRVNTGNYPYGFHAGIYVLTESLACKGQTEINISSTGETIVCSGEGGITLSDGLAILTPAGGSLQKSPTISNAKKTILDAAGKVATDLRIGKGGGSTQTGTWKKDGKGWWYKRADGTYPKSTWEKIGGKWYHFDDKGYMQTGWFQEGGKWYYLSGSGAMVTGWQKISNKWYYLGTDGAMRTGWMKEGGTWYYLKSGGEMATGWLKISGKWYYFGTNGKMVANTTMKIGDKTYKFDASGACTNP